MCSFNGPKSDKFGRRCAKFSPLLLDRALLASDDFRMFTFKIKLCPVNRPHDWTECPYAHRGEKARRRDPVRVNYLAVACPDHRARPGECPRGELCGLAHGVFEYWLHPAKYRTRPCNAGSHCGRKVCFFAHGPSEVRPGVDYGVYWGLGTTSAAAGLLPEATELGRNGAGLDGSDFDQADLEWVWKLIE
uniref:C3H1-type domain-containing protein n=1 Tax=Kalanchoe fedtschenkoi TaxID=63787 RepID=A0A7N0V910_KALFE